MNAGRQNTCRARESYNQHERRRRLHSPRIRGTRTILASLTNLSTEFSFSLRCGDSKLHWPCNKLRLSSPFSGGRLLIDARDRDHLRLCYYSIQVGCKGRFAGRCHDRFSRTTLASVKLVPLAVRQSQDALRCRSSGCTRSGSNGKAQRMKPRDGSSIAGFPLHVAATLPCS